MKSLNTDIFNKKLCIYRPHIKVPTFSFNTDRESHHRALPSLHSALLKWSLGLVLFSRTGSGTGRLLQAGGRHLIRTASQRANPSGTQLSTRFPPEQRQRGGFKWVWSFGGTGSAPCRWTCTERLSVPSSSAAGEACSEPSGRPASEIQQWKREKWQENMVKVKLWSWYFKVKVLPETRGYSGYLLKWQLLRKL